MEEGGKNSWDIWQVIRPAMQCKINEKSHKYQLVIMRVIFMYCLNMIIAVEVALKQFGEQTNFPLAWPEPDCISVN